VISLAAADADYRVEPADAPPEAPALLATPLTTQPASLGDIRAAAGAAWETGRTILTLDAEAVAAIAHLTRRPLIAVDLYALSVAEAGRASAGREADGRGRRDRTGGAGPGRRP
jgi:hypothetical protein